MRKLDEILKNERIWGHEIMFPLHSAWVKLPDCGRCSVIWSDCEDGMEHVSVSPRKQFRIPSWDDMCLLKDIEWAEIVGINAHCLLHRKKLGWTIEKILTIPLKGRRNVEY